MSNSSATEAKAAPITTEALEADGWEGGYNYNFTQLWYYKFINSGNDKMIMVVFEGGKISVRLMGDEPFTDTPQSAQTIQQLRDLHERLRGDVQTKIWRSTVTTDDFKRAKQAYFEGLESATDTKPKQRKGSDER